MSPEAAATHSWIEHFVIRLGLCPFAVGPLQAGLVDITVCPERDPEAAFYWAGAQVQRLLETPAAVIETSLLLFPGSLDDFGTFLDFVETLEDFLEKSRASRFTQLAHFHPLYTFADAAEDDPANATNQAPYPTIQLLRTESVARAIAAYPGIDQIPVRNAALLRTGN